MGYSANYIAFGFQPSDIADSKFDRICETPDNMTRLKDMQHARQLVVQNLQKDHERQKKFYDRRHRTHDYQINDKVLVYNPSFRQGTAKAFTTPFHGPGTVIKKLHNNAYQVRIQDKRGNWIIDDVAIQRLRPYYEDVLYLEKYGIEEKNE